MISLDFGTFYLDFWLSDMPETVSSIWPNAVLLTNIILFSLKIPSIVVLGCVNTCLPPVYLISAAWVYFKCEGTIFNPVKLVW